MRVQLRMKIRFNKTYILYEQTEGDMLSWSYMQHHFEIFSIPWRFWKALSQEIPQFGEPMGKVRYTSYIIYADIYVCSLLSNKH